MSSPPIQSRTADNGAVSEYTATRREAVRLKRALVDATLDPIIKRAFEADRGHAIVETLPDGEEVYEFHRRGVTAHVYPTAGEITNYTWHGNPLTVDNIFYSPVKYRDVPDVLAELWDDTTPVSGHPDYPGPPPVPLEELDGLLSALAEQRGELLTMVGSYDAFVDALVNKDAEVAAATLNDVPSEVRDPGGDLAPIFTGGGAEVTVVERWDDMAVLYPTINKEAWADVINQRLPIGRALESLDGVPEEAVVVGVDDTPVGLFAHPVDATNLRRDAQLTKTDVREAMGFTRDAVAEESFAPDGGRVRLQGDLAVDTAPSEAVPVDQDIETQDLWLQIDNHLVIVEDGYVPPRSDRQEEPVRVAIPDHTHLQVRHDEHDDRVHQLAPGVYEFYLLPRGPRLPTDRPAW